MTDNRFTWSPCYDEHLWYASLAYLSWGQHGGSITDKNYLNSPLAEFILGNIKIYICIFYPSQYRGDAGSRGPLCSSWSVPMLLMLWWRMEQIYHNIMKLCMCFEWFGYSHDDVIKWKYFPRNWPFVRGIHRSQVNSPHKGQWHGALMFSLICVWIND